ncbi:CBS domain-containing protein [uncultured Fusobacterium sp.]|jgi:CBS domain-containing protein|uniref:CBS domain-containing protein n=1 Tax=uncultured Fusobacterium sp. TaxID=159267 RepID=UPI0025F91F8B|nr:CBS domain-containing protein [uncultured Fusobacterium sp.]
MKKVRDVINSNVQTITRETLVGEIVSIMKEKRLGKLPVLDGDKIVGVVTRDDILVKQGKSPVPPVIAFWEIMIALPNSKGFKEKMKKFISFKAEDIMEKNFYTADIDADLEGVVSEMLDKDYNYALVLENEKLVGIVTKSDLINKCY